MERNDSGTAAGSTSGAGTSATPIGGTAPARGQAAATATLQPGDAAAKQADEAAIASANAQTPTTIRTAAQQTAIDDDMRRRGLEPQRGDHVLIVGPQS